MNSGFVSRGEPEVWALVATAHWVVQEGAGAEPDVPSRCSIQMRLLGVIGAMLETPGSQKVKKWGRANRSDAIRTQQNSAVVDLGMWVEFRCLHPISADSISFWDTPLEPASTDR